MALKVWCGVVAVACGACGGKAASSGELSGDEGDGGRAGANAASPTAASASTGGTGLLDEPTDSLGGAADGAGGNSGIPLVPMDGWVDGMSNELGIQGAMFAFADTTTQMSLTEAHAGTKVCIKGTTALVDLTCTPVLPARDCFEQFFGAVIELDLNQQLDPTGEATAPLPYDASRILAFAFTVDGAIVPDFRRLRFRVEGAEQSFCNPIIGAPSATAVLAGENHLALDDLVETCWKSNHGPAATTVKTMLTRISWQVVPNTTSTVPFDFCISNVRAITD